MKKGDLRKDSILRTAEHLFFEKGYEETSIQDILDELSISKGGFYHHFDSKIAVLTEICRQRGEVELNRVRAEMKGGKLKSVQKLNLLLRYLHMFNREDTDFTALVLKVSYLDGDVNFREQMRAFNASALMPMLDGVIAEGIADGSFFTRHPDQLGRILLMLASDVNDETCRVLAERVDEPECAIEILSLLDAYREAAETLTGAGFGKIELFDLEHLMETIRQTTDHLKFLKEKSGMA